MDLSQTIGDESASKTWWKDDFESTKDIPIESLKSKVKAMLNKSPNICDIDKIFEHVINESRRVNECIKQVSEEESKDNPRRSFIKFYETAKNEEIDESLKHFIIVGDEENSNIIKSESYYWTKHGRVKGILSITESYLMFDVQEWEENDTLLANIMIHNSDFEWNMFSTKFQACIDFDDIVSMDILKLPNDTFCYIADDESRKWYLFDYYIQLSVSWVNGKALAKLLEKHPQK